MAIIVANNAVSKLVAGISSTTTSISITGGTGAKFPSTAAGDSFYITVSDSSNNFEIMLVTSRTGDNLVVVRGQENTTAKTFSVGDRVINAITASAFNEKATQTALDVVDTRVAAIEASSPSNVTKTSDTGSALLPAGTTAQRDASPTDGALRFNSTLNQIEAYANSNWVNLGGGFSHMEVHLVNTPWVVPAGVTKVKVTVVGGGGGNSTGGTSSFGSLLSATGGGAQISGVYGSSTNLAPAFNTAGVGVGGDINLYGQVGTDSVNANLSGSAQTRLANAAGGMTALGFGRGSNIAVSETVSANGRVVARGGAGGGAAVSMLALTPGDTHEIIVGPGGGNGAVGGRVIIEY